jgi:hypothetical protein
MDRGRLSFSFPVEVAAKGPCAVTAGQTSNAASRGGGFGLTQQRSDWMMRCAKSMRFSVTKRKRHQDPAAARPGKSLPHVLRNLVACPLL